MQQETVQPKPEESSSAIETIKKSLEANPNPTILCETKENNPNYLAINYANQKFYEIFGIEEFNLIGKNYDFLFNDVDVDAASDDQLEYIRLIKDVKRFN